MIRNNTVVVVGAGASNDLGLPVGSGLQNRVAEILSRSDELSRYLNSACHHRLARGSGNRSTDAYRIAQAHSAQIKSAASIDNFLDQHRDNQDLVDAIKIVIAYVIAEAEMKSSISLKSGLSDVIARNENYFLYDFLNILSRGHQSSSIGDSLQNLTFIIFNYDRCVERFIDLWMEFRFGREFRWRQDGPKIIHVYGSLGDYFDGNSHNPFMAENDVFLNPHLQLPGYVDKIKIFTEQEDSAVRTQVEDAVGGAEVLMFLGFGFEEQNMRFFDGGYANISVFSTFYGMSGENSRFLREDLANRFSSSQRSVFASMGKSRQMMKDLYFPLTKLMGSI